ncbi:MAG TPA: hypothetical protein VIV11_40395 [Kofleriaceae bacterium]
MTALVACGNQVALEVGPGEADDGGGKADGAEARAELKVTLEPTDIRRARYRLSLLNDQSQQRSIWFFDTPALTLLDAGLILRAREIDGEEDDSTVKLRPFTLDDLSEEFRVLDDMKCELDRLPDTATPSCSLKIDQDEGEIASVARGERTLDKLYSSEQEALFAAYGPAIGLDELATLGPIRARVWTLRSDELPEKVTAELWYLADGSQTLELSMKVDAADQDDGMADLLDFVEDRGLHLDKEQESKTRRALELLIDATAIPRR